MRELDEKEVKIIRELIRDPRASDNQIAKRTNIPVMTVNRKRKKLEEEKLLRYYTSIDKGEFGLKVFGAKTLFVIKFKIGITRQTYYETLEKDPTWRMFNSHYISLAYLGEKDGHLALIIILDAKTREDLVEEFNGKIVPFLEEKLGQKCIKDIITTNLDRMVRVHHNYMPAMNMENGKIKKEWPDSLIFVNEV
ncbi:MAG: Lrp/AsnC family transcriptional regulator [Candidatus Aenigmarchaeota archaeon]|nr:Lrp/AsnC family transcriptional regulator [Candidatus Aenigmarchaeota archaeon]